MENFLRKYGWALMLGVIGVGALLLALTANNILASQLAPFTVPELPEMQQVAPRPARASQSKDWDRTIAKLCLFGCEDNAPVEECPGGCPDGQECQAGQCLPVQDQAVDSGLPTLSDLNMQLMGAMVASNPEFSMALLRDESSDATMIMSTGDFIQGTIEIIEIRRDRILLSRGGRTEYMLMNQTLGGAPTSATRTSGVTRPRAAAKALAPTLGKAPRVNSATQGAVKKVSDNQYELKRGALDKQLNDPKALAEQGRIAPNFKDGKRDGLKLVGLSPNSVYSQLGIQSGDVLQSVNGKKIDTTSQAMDLFEQFKSSGEVTVEIERRGQKKRMQYKIH